MTHLTVFRSSMLGRENIGLHGGKISHERRAFASQWATALKSKVEVAAR